jgi:prepilin peptidase CpaA
MISPVPSAGQLALTLLVTAAAIYDLRFRRIPNWLVLAGLITGIGLNTFLLGWAGLRGALLGLGLGFVLYFPLYLLRARGAGDVKLLAAVGSIAGPGDCFVICLLAAVLGGLAAIVLLLARGRVRKTFWNVGWILHDLIHLRAPYASSEELDVNSPKAVRLPHGAVIALGVFAFLGVLQAEFRG